VQLVPASGPVLVPVLRPRAAAPPERASEQGPGAALRSAVPDAVRVRALLPAAVRQAAVQPALALEQLPARKA
jgi:hypothetical protein